MQTPLRGKRESQAGLSMAELLVAMVIVTIVGTMLVASWISLQRSFAFAQAKNTARATARDALARMSSELRAAQPPTDSSITPFYLLLAPPYVCGETSCVFYSAYNNSAAAQDGTGRAQLRLTKIWLDKVSWRDTAKTTLYWQRDRNNDRIFSAAVDGSPLPIATGVVNAAASVNKPIFTYTILDPYGRFVPGVTNLTSSNVAYVRSVQIRLVVWAGRWRPYVAVVDGDLSRNPRYIDLTTTVRPRNAGTF